MAAIVLEKVDAGNFDEFVDLIRALANFEHLVPPDLEAVSRLREHAMGSKIYYEAYIARSNGMAVAYLILLETYSSFLAKPTLYVEDIFVLEPYRKKGIGKELFTFCAKKALEKGCGRMEWQALDWNINAIQFYERMGGRHLKEWISFRMDEADISELASARR